MRDPPYRDLIIQELSGKKSETSAWFGENGEPFQEF
jgi:hypothetical protein